MDTPDARTLSNETLEQLRQQTVRLHRRGATNTAIAEIVGVDRRTVAIWLQRYTTGGAAPCGPSAGAGRSASSAP